MFFFKRILGASIVSKKEAIPKRKQPMMEASVKMATF